MALHIENCAILMLAGGESLRMGNNKALLDIQGQAMYKKIIASIQELRAPVYISCRPSQQSLFPTDKILVESPPHEGPMTGIRTAFKYSVADHWLILSCDMPHVNSAMLGLLIDNISMGVDAVAFLDSKEFKQPFPSLWTKGIPPDIMQSAKSPLQVLNKVNTKWIIHEDAKAFTNVNTPEEWMAYESGFKEKIAK